MTDRTPGYLESDSGYQERVKFAANFARLDQHRNRRWAVISSRESLKEDDALDATGGWKSVRSTFPYIQ